MVATAELGSGHQTGSLHPQGKKQNLFSVTHSHSLLANSTDRQHSCAEGSPLLVTASLLGESLDGDAGSSCHQRSSQQTDTSVSLAEAVNSVMKHR